MSEIIPMFTTVTCSVKGRNQHIKCKFHGRRIEAMRCKITNTRWSPWLLFRGDGVLPHKPQIVGKILSAVWRNNIAEAYCD